MRRPYPAALAAAVALALLAGCGGGSSLKATVGPGDAATIATAKIASLPVYTDPTSPAPQRSLPNPTETGAPLVALVERRKGDWLKILLPVRPNGSTGWIRTDQVTLKDTEYKMIVELSKHQLRVTNGDKLVLKAPIAVGTSDTPTPGGKYYIKELLKPPSPDGPYGTYAYGLSGFSNVLTQFGSGNGVIGIHGTNEPSVIGTDVSHGCIRMRNEDIDRLVPVLPLGTPVQIRS